MADKPIEFYDETEELRKLRERLRERLRALQLPDAYPLPADVVGSGSDVTVGDLLAALHHHKWSLGALRLALVAEIVTLLEKRTAQRRGAINRNRQAGRALSNAQAPWRRTFEAYLRDHPETSKTRAAKIAARRHGVSARHLLRLLRRDTH